MIFEMKKFSVLFPFFLVLFVLVTHAYAYSDGPDSVMIKNLENQHFDIKYFDYYTRSEAYSVPFVSGSGNRYSVGYYIYTPKNINPDESTPVIAYVSHGGGTSSEEKAFSLHCAANLATDAVIIIPNSDRAEAVCCCIEDARKVLDGKGDFDAVSIHGTSSGGRAIIAAAEESVNPDGGYHFRFLNICAYDPAADKDLNIAGNTEALKALAEQGTVLFIQTDLDISGHHGGSGLLCGKYAEAYSEAGGTVILAEIHGGGDHERKFIKPITHNSLNWAIGNGMLVEDDHYQNDWFYYEGDKKIPSTPE